MLFADEADLARPQSAIGRIAHGFYWTEGRGGLGWAPDAVPTLKNGSTIGIPSPPAVLRPEGLVIKPDLRDAERLQGFPADWTAPAEDVARRSSRWGLVGSAVSVPVAQWIGERLLAPGRHDRCREEPFPISGAAPRAACFDGRQRRAVRIGPDPLGIRPSSLLEFLRFVGEPLSARATAGFLARTRSAKLRFAPGFIAAIEAHLTSVSQTSPIARASHLRVQRLENRVA